ncbi:uncharacterized protein LOC123661644 isoform X2 [Melitaea cinxia]|nr:uncharacterized protein LOC123661644 isoform X2 [Melitaea cinxia]
MNKIFYSNTIKIDFQDIEKNVRKISLEMGDSVGFKEFCGNFVKSDTKLLLTNLCSYENKWNKRDIVSSGTTMKVYNSFTYTEDIKYEARLLELPMKNDFKLVIIIPNEVGILCNLFNKLYNNGLKAAIISTQPLFTTFYELKAPNIKFSCTPDMVQHFSYNCWATTEYGNVKIDENGVSIKVITHMIPSNTKPRECLNLEQHELNKTFFFGLVYEDTPIFTGQYVNIE